MPSRVCDIPETCATIGGVVYHGDVWKLDVPYYGGLQWPFTWISAISPSSV